MHTHTEPKRLELRKEILHDPPRPVDDLVERVLGDVVRRADHDVVTGIAVLGAGAWVEEDVVGFAERWMTCQYFSGKRVGKRGWGTDAHFWSKDMAMSADGAKGSLVTLSLTNSI